MLRLSASKFDREAGIDACDRQASKVVDSAYEMFGSDAIFKSNPLQCQYQDMHVIAQQIQGRPTDFETAGRYFLGLETGTML